MRGTEEFLRELGQHPKARFPIFEGMAKGETEFECRISAPQVEEGRLYATVFADSV